MRKLIWVLIVLMGLAYFIVGLDLALQSWKEIGPILGVLSFAAFLVYLSSACVGLVLIVVGIKQYRMVRPPTPK